MDATERISRHMIVYAVVSRKPDLKLGQQTDISKPLMQLISQPPVMAMPKIKDFCSLKKRKNPVTVTIVAMT